MSFGRPLVALIMALCVVVACGGGSSSNTPKTAGPGTASPTRASSGSGFLIITRPEGLIEYDIADGRTRTLLPAPTPDTFVLDPAISADGTLLTYVAEPPPKVEGGVYDAGADLWVANRDGTNTRAVFTHTTPNQIVRFPQWEDDGHIVAVVQEIEKDNGVTSVKYKLERIDVATGQRTVVLENVLSMGISPDRKRVAYAELAPQTGETLVEAELATGTKRPLVGLEQNLSPFNFPRYSPNGAQIAFASADQTGARAPIQYVLATTSGIGRATTLDGLPEDIWTIDTAGGPPRRVADIKEDLPALAWDGRGEHIYVIGSVALYDVNMTNGAVDKIGEGSFHGQVVWAP